jgi:AcrR family transcriptional regulator
MSAVNGLRPNLRERQKDSTREEIVSTAMRLLRDSGDMTHEAIAEQSGMSVRTVFRHFPSRDVLIAATWERLKADTGTRFPQSEAEIVEMAPDMYRRFDDHHELVRAFLFSGVGSEVRDAGAVEGREAFERALHQVTKHLPPQRRRQATAVFLALYSAPAWQLMRDRGRLSGEEAAQAVKWAMSTLLESLKSHSN